MSRKSSIDPEVMQSEEYLDQTLAAQALYPQLLMECDTMGVIVGIRRVVRATGIDGADNALDELIANGYVVPVEMETGTVHVIRHHFINNNYEKRLTDFSKFKGRLPEYIETPVKGGQLYGVPYKSATSSAQVVEERIGEDRIGEEGRGEERKREEERGATLHCPNCGSDVTTGMRANGFVQFECMSCGESSWINEVTGEVSNNPVR